VGREVPVRGAALREPRALRAAQGAEHRLPHADLWTRWRKYGVAGPIQVSTVASFYRCFETHPCGGGITSALNQHLLSERRRGAGGRNAQLPSASS